MKLDLGSIPKICQCLHKAHLLNTKPNFGKSKTRQWLFARHSLACTKVAGANFEKTILIEIEFIVLYPRKKVNKKPSNHERSKLQEEIKEKQEDLPK